MANRNSEYVVTFTNNNDGSRLGDHQFQATSTMHDLCNYVTQAFFHGLQFQSAEGHKDDIQLQNLPNVGYLQQNPPTVGGQSIKWERPQITGFEKIPPNPSISLPVTEQDINNSRKM